MTRGLWTAFAASVIGLSVAPTSAADVTVWAHQDDLQAVAGTPGTKLGFSVLLNDNDGRRRAAHMNWGGGLAPVWLPADLGVVTFGE